ncbi:hypothetical protein HZB03_05270, partial [Candidatus Woesearchaeota archaeon]|nr:hypothetical protein [Candidatus Woesearchaeota archaeon]
GRTIELGVGLLKFVHNPQGDVEALEEPYCSTNNMAVKKKAFLSVGGFDPYFRFACEDVDFCFRVQKQGYKLVPNTEMAIDHRHPGNFLGWLKKSYVYEPGLCAFMEKYPETKRFFPWYYVLFPLIAARQAWRRAKGLNRPLRTLPLIPIYATFIFAGILGKVKHVLKNKKYRLLWYVPNLHVIYEKIK